MAESHAVHKNIYLLKKYQSKKTWFARHLERVDCYKSSQNAGGLIRIFIYESHDLTGVKGTTQGVGGWPQMVACPF